MLGWCLWLQARRRQAERGCDIGPGGVPPHAANHLRAALRRGLALALATRLVRRARHHGVPNDELLTLGFYPVTAVTWVACRVLPFVGANTSTRISSPPSPWVTRSRPCCPPLSQCSSGDPVRPASFRPAAAPIASSSPPTATAAVAGVVEMRDHTEHHQRQSSPIWVLLHLVPLFHTGYRKLFHFLVVQVSWGGSAWGGAPEDGPGGGAGADSGVQVPAELGRSPLHRFGRHRSASRNTYRYTALSGWVDERETLIWVTNVVDRYWLGLPVGAHFLDEQDPTQPISSIGLGIDHRLEAV
jgi:hypothetical protein